MQHPYLACNIEEATLISDKLDEIKGSSLKCFDTVMKGSTSMISQITSNTDKGKDKTALWFNTKIPAVFDEFYSFITGNEAYKTPHLMQEAGAASEVISGFSSLLNKEENKEQVIWRSSRVIKNKNREKPTATYEGSQNVSGIPDMGFTFMNTNSALSRHQEVQSKISSKKDKEYNYNILVLGGQRAGKKTFMRQFKYKEMRAD